MKTYTEYVVAQIITYISVCSSIFCVVFVAWQCPPQFYIHCMKNSSRENLLNLSFFALRKDIQTHLEQHEAE